MPELPDVERIVREIRPALVGRRIDAVRLLSPASVRSPAPGAFRRQLRGQRIQSVRRRGKFILVDVTTGTLAIHLRMTGFLAVRSAGARPAGAARAWFSLDDGRRLWFCDARRLGTLDWLPPGASLPALDAMGPEPLTETFTLSGFAASLCARGGAVKAVLLDQRVVAGVGNVYADDILFAARVHPRRPASSLSPPEARTMHRTIRGVLSRAVAYEGDDWERPGSFLDARQRGLACPRCRAGLARVSVSGRTTVYCAQCQRGPAEENQRESRIGNERASTARGSRWARDRHR